MMKDITPEDIADALRAGRDEAGCLVAAGKLPRAGIDGWFHLDKSAEYLNRVQREKFVAPKPPGSITERLEELEKREEMERHLSQAVAKIEAMAKIKAFLDSGPGSISGVEEETRAFQQYFRQRISAGAKIADLEEMMMCQARQIAIRGTDDG